jgi:iron complex transport system substrate-binding protein
MRLFFVFFISFFAASLFFLGCAAPSPKAENQAGKVMANAAATNFSFTEWGTAGALLLTIKSPWQGGEVQKYLLCPREKIATLGALPQGVQLIATPVQRIVCTSTIQAAMLEKLGLADKIVAMSDGKYLYNSDLRAAVASGKILDLGGDQIIDFEKLIAARPDIVLLFGLAAPAKLQSKLQELQISHLYMAEYIENTPLGRAEWICVLGALAGDYSKAKQLFDSQIFAPYVQIRAENTPKKAEQKAKPKVLTGIAYEGVWYVAGGRNFLATLIADAGGDYIFAADSSAGSVPLAFERVYAESQKAEIWINLSEAKTKKQLLGFDARYADFAAFSSGKIYNYHRRCSPNGGFDVFESAIVQPHLLLADLRHIFHADSVRADSLFYYLPLE